MAMKKKLNILGLILSLALVLSACAPSSGNESNTELQDITVGVLYDFLSVESRVRQKTEIERYAAEKGVNLVFQSANADEKLQLQQAENLITQNVDALVILPQNAQACKPIAKECKDAGIPFIVTDRLILDADIDYFVGLDNVVLGNMQVDYALEVMPRGKWALVSGAPTDPNCRIWHDAWIEKTKPYVDKGEIEIVSDEKCDNWDPNIALKHMENTLTANNDQIDVALVMNDGLATGVNQAFEARGLAGNVVMTGMDAETVALQRIVEGKQSMTILFDDFAIARALVDTAIQAATGQEVATNGLTNNGFEDVPSVLIESLAITKDNINEKVIDAGFSTVEDVYANVPKDQWPK